MARSTTPPFAPDGIRALVFDVFGTVVDWHGSIVREVQACAARWGVAVDAAAFARDWRAGYQPAMQTVRAGQRAWTDLDTLHRGILDRLWPAHGLPPEVPEAERADLNRVWHRLDPWPDTAPGLARLRRRGVCTTLSNGHLALLVNLARHGGLAWDAVLSAELFQRYKPEPEVYEGAARLLRLAPGEVLMVAAHPSDLRAAARCGLRTAYLPRPDEHGPGGWMEPHEPGEFDLEVAGGLIGLADALDAPGAQGEAAAQPASGASRTSSVGMAVTGR